MQLESIQCDLDEIKTDLKDVKQSLTQLAVQDNRLRNLEHQVEAWWRKHDDLKACVEKIARHEASCPREQVSKVDEQLQRVAQFQASCPRRQIATLWMVVIPQSLVLLGLFATIVKMWM